MPSNIRNFLLLGFLSLLIGVVVSVFRFEQSVEEAAMVGGAGFVIAVQVITFGLVALLLVLAGWGRKNWARWVFLALFVLGLPMFVIMFPTMTKSDPVQAVTAVLQAVFQLVATYLVFTGNAKAWFRKETATS